MVSASEMERHPADSEIRADWDISAWLQRCNKFFCASWSSSQHRSSVFIRGVHEAQPTQEEESCGWLQAQQRGMLGLLATLVCLKRGRTVTRGLITRSGFMRLDVLCMYNCWCSYAKDKIYKMAATFSSRKKLFFFNKKTYLWGGGLNHNKHASKIFKSSSEKLFKEKNIKQQKH